MTAGPTGRWGVTVVVLAKAPMAGRSKTRLCPPYSPEQAAALAQAALEDTLATVLATPGVRPVLALDGEPGCWLPVGLPVIAQRRAGLAERIAGALEDAVGLRGAPVLLIGMDTPQLGPALLGSACAALLGGPAAARPDAVLGLAADGGWWALGLHEPSEQLLVGVPMSTRHTGLAQRQRLLDAGLGVHDLPVLQDVDTAGDAHDVARLAPTTRFAALLGSLACSVVPPAGREPVEGAA